ITHLELCGQEKACRIAQVEIVNNRNNRSGIWPAVDSKQLCHFARLAAIKEYRCRIGLEVSEATALSQSFGKQNPPAAETELQDMATRVRCRGAGTTKA